MKSHAFVRMLELQDKMNTKVNADWREQNFAWFRALWIEAGELVDHYGYKWWKQQSPDMEQVKLEIVDIWHFGLSMMLSNQDYQSIADHIVEQLAQADDEVLPVIEATEALACDVLSTRKFNPIRFAKLLDAAQMSWDELYQAYIGKNVLNFFRQDHGYKDGTYIKQWHGREDNEHLVEVIASLDSQADDFAEQLYQGLAKVYQSVQAAAV